ncbi:MAG: hypothetical protein ACK53Y_09675, partial [bacterium]
SERALLGQLVMRGMLVKAPVGTKNGDEAREQAHFSFHKSRLPFKKKAIQRVVQLQHRQPHFSSRPHSRSQPFLCKQIQDQQLIQRQVQLQKPVKIQSRPKKIKATKEKK